MPYGSESQVKSLKQQNPFEIARNREMQQYRVTLVVSTDSGHFVWIIFYPVHLGIGFFGPGKI